MSRPPIPTPPSPQPSGGPQRRWLALIPVLAGALLLFIAVLVILFFVVRSLLPGEEDIPGTSLPVTRIPPTPTLPVSPVEPPAARCLTIISSDDVQVAASLPVTLTVGSVSFPVNVVIPDETGWDSPSSGAGTAAWVCGTVVNYVLELDPASENEALLANLKPGDEITLSLSNGTVFVFWFAERRAGVPTDDAALFAQFEPRLTLLIGEQGGTWKVTTASYASQRESVQPPSPGMLFQPGQSASVGDAQVTAHEGYAVRSDDLAAGMMYYLVEFSVENAGSTPLDTGTFEMKLQDGVGNVYLLSPAASALGDSGMLGGQIAPGATAEGTAGYVVPDTLAGPALVWTFTADEGQVSVGIPYTEEESVEPAQARVTIYDALVSDNGKLVIQINVQNVGGEPLTMTQDDISLSSSAGMSDRPAVAPPLPLIVEAGQNRDVNLTFEKPDAASAVLEVLGYSFAIGGLD